MSEPPAPVPNSASARLVPDFPPRLGENQAEYRERLAMVQAEALERRQQELGEQCSPLKTAADRIRIWERLHQLPMPINPSHRLITVIAENTGLTLAEVLAEQQERATAKPAAPLV